MTLTEEPGTRTFRFALERDSWWKSVSLRATEVNDPDVVTTDDVKFDSVITVLAHDGMAPRARAVFQTKLVQKNLSTLFKRYPFAELVGGTLTVRAQADESSSALLLGSNVMRALQTAIDSAPFQSLEQQPVIGEAIEKKPAEIATGLRGSPRFLIAALALGLVGYGLAAYLSSEGAPHPLAFWVFFAFVAVAALVLRSIDTGEK